MLRKVGILGLLFAILLVIGILPAYAQQNSTLQGLVISPAIQEIEAEAGQNYSVDYTITNNTGIPKLTTGMSVETFEEGSIQGSANIVPFKADNDISFWLNVPKTQTFNQGINTSVNYQLSIPDNTKAGAYFFAIVYQPKTQTTINQDKTNLVLQERIASLLFVNVGGDESKQPAINNFSDSLQVVDTFFDKIDVSYEVEIKGSSFYRPAGNIFLTDDSSDTITTLSSISSENIILPGGKRSYKECFGNNIFLEKCPEQTAANLPIVGSKNIDIRLDFTNGNNNSQSVIAHRKVLFFPYKSILVAISAIVIILLSIRLLRRFRKRNK